MRQCKRWITILFSGGVLLQTGSCLPADFFAQLASSSLTTVANAFVNAFVTGLLGTPA